MSMFDVVMTSNGVPAMRDRASGEVMHPGAGPLIESQRVYVEPARLAQRLCAAPALPLVLFDVGLGAGSNAIAAWHTARACSAAQRRLNIVSFDRTASALELALQPAHAVAFGFDIGANAAANTLLRAGDSHSAHAHWQLRLGDIQVELAREPAASADIVFWDPFSPRTNPELWSVAAFSAVRRVCRAGATVHTYSGATLVRAALLLAGFAVGFGIAATQKQKHSTVAALAVADLAQPLSRTWFERFASSSAAWPAGAPADTLERLRALPQFA